MKALLSTAPKCEYFQAPTFSRVDGAFPGTNSRNLFNRNGNKTAERRKQRDSKARSRFSAEQEEFPPRAEPRPAARTKLTPTLFRVAWNIYRSGRQRVAKIREEKILKMSRNEGGKKSGPATSTRGSCAYGLNNICVNKIYARIAYVAVAKVNCPRPSGVVAGARFRFPVSRPEEPRDPGSPSTSPPLPRASRSLSSCRPAGIKRTLFIILFLVKPNQYENDFLSRNYDCTTRCDI